MKKSYSLSLFKAIQFNDLFTIGKMFLSPSPMTEPGKFFEYTGPVDQEVIDQLLKNLKITRDFKDLNKTTARRIYAILVECLENIAKYCEKNKADNYGKLPYISAVIRSDKIIIKSGNTVAIDKVPGIKKKLDHLNSLDPGSITTLYEHEINDEPEKSENGAGLGFMLIRLKSGNPIEYVFTQIDSSLSYFEIQISINKYIMRKLIIDQMANAPKVTLDPEKRIFELSGESRPADVSVFYNEILSWMDDFSFHLLKSKEETDPLIFNLDFEYFNSSSAKNILDFCKKINNVRSKGKDISVKWHYEKDDLDMLDAGKEISRLAKMPFEYVQKENQ